MARTKTRKGDQPTKEDKAEEPLEEKLFNVKLVLKPTAPILQDVLAHAGIDFRQENQMITCMIGLGGLTGASAKQLIAAIDSDHLEEASMERHHDQQQSSAPMLVNLG